VAKKPKPCKSEPEVCHRKIDPEVCPRCGSDATSAVVMDEVEGTVCCSTCGIHYEAVREAGLKYVYWTDDDGEHFVFDDEYLVRTAEGILLTMLEPIQSNGHVIARQLAKRLGTGII
jgi:hypothetical protein